MTISPGSHVLFFPLTSHRVNCDGHAPHLPLTIREPMSHFTQELASLHSKQLPGHLTSQSLPLQPAGQSFSVYYLKFKTIKIFSLIHLVHLFMNNLNSLSFVKI
jgi:hypothetical protein